jgi:cytochrome P450
MSEVLRFGFGTHRRLGWNLARVELEVALPRLSTRIPDLRLAVTHDDLEFAQNSIVYRLHAPPLTWGPTDL